MREGMPDDLTMSNGNMFGSRPAETLGDKLWRVPWGVLAVAALLAAIGTMRATGRLRTRTVTVSPRCTLRITPLNPAFSSRMFASMWSPQ